MAIELNVGDSLAVLLMDGVEATPYVGATLRMTERGVEVEVPHLHGHAADQFSHVDDWFRKMSLPENMVAHTREGAIYLFGCRWSGYSPASGTRVGTGKFRVTEALLNEWDARLSSQFVVQICRSQADGMIRWSRRTAVTTDSVLNEAGRTKALDIHVETPTPIEWQQGTATLRIRNSWRSEQIEDGLTRIHQIADDVVLESEFNEPRSFIDHLVEQRKALHLLVFLFGTGLSFRKHRVQDESITTRLLTGKVVGNPFSEVISVQTMRERSRPIPARNQLDRPLLVLDELGAEGLATWGGANYEAWERFILPSVTIIEAQHRFVEDIVTSTSMSMEAAGQLLGKQSGEESTYGQGRKPAPTTATNVYRCLAVLDIGWGDYIHSNVGLARAVANSYNTIKHPSRGGFPDPAETHLVADVSELIVRLLAVRLTGQVAKLLTRYAEGNELWPIKQRFETQQLRIADENGSWIAAAVD